MGILIQNTISKFSKPKNQTQKLLPKFKKKLINIYKEASHQNVLKNRPPPKVGILIQNTILKFSTTKNQTQKRPSKVPKNQKHI